MKRPLAQWTMRPSNGADVVCPLGVLLSRSNMRRRLDSMVIRRTFSPLKVTQRAGQPFLRETSELILVS